MDGRGNIADIGRGDERSVVDHGIGDILLYHRIGIC